MVRDIPCDIERFQAALNSETYPCPFSTCRGEITVEWEWDYDEWSGRSWRYPVNFVGTCADSKQIASEHEGDDDDGTPINWYYDRNHGAQMRIWTEEGNDPYDAPWSGMLERAAERYILRRLYYQGW